MRSFLISAALGFIAFNATAGKAALASSPAAAKAVAHAVGAALQADLAQALHRLGRLPAREFKGEDAALRACMLGRFAKKPAFDTPTTTSDPFAAEVLAAYRAYWLDALLHPRERPAAEKDLLRRLNRLLGRAAADLDALEPLLKERLSQAGFHSLQGVTLPLRELMLWSSEEARSYRVELPDGAYTTRVMVLSDFASLGWADHATCGRRGAGGWTTKDALYVVAPRYKNLEDEEFRVSFLGHETQHFADLARFPGMASWELEYRAKLVELAQAQDTRARILAKFNEDQGDDKAVPHSYANRRVLAAVRRRTGLADDADLEVLAIPMLQAAAAEELREDTRRRLIQALPND